MSRATEAQTDIAATRLERLVVELEGDARTLRAYKQFDLADAPQTEAALYRALLAERAELLKDRERLQSGIVECFDVAVPQAMPWTGTFSEKAEYAAKVLPEQLRAEMRMQAMLGAYQERHSWKPISEMHEDFGQCVLFDADSGHVIGNNLDLWFDEQDYACFCPIPKLTEEQYKAYDALRDAATPPKSEGAK